jgi:ribonuclease HI
LYKLLKKSDSFHWTDETQKALDELKAPISKPTVLASLEPGEILLIYIVATTQVISAALVLEREELGHIYKVQRPVYYINKVLSDWETHYNQVQKLLYAILIIKRKLLDYFESHTIHVITSYGFEEIIGNCLLTWRITMWALQLMGIDISYIPQMAIKSQALADFVFEWIETQQPLPLVTQQHRSMYFDGSFTINGIEGGVILISTKGDWVLNVIQLHLHATNNVAKYEALVNGVRIASELTFQWLYICNDYELVINKVMGESNYRNSRMVAYRHEVGGSRKSSTVSSTIKSSDETTKQLTPPPDSGRAVRHPLQGCSRRTYSSPPFGLCPGLCREPH